MVNKIKYFEWDLKELKGQNYTMSPKVDVKQFDKKGA